MFSMDRCLCAKEVATVLGVSERTALRLMRSGEVEAFRVGKLWRTTPDKIEAYRSSAFEKCRPHGMLTLALN
jgi:excisionase family DNA binding protein